MDVITYEQVSVDHTTGEVVKSIKSYKKKFEYRYMKTFYDQEWFNRISGNELQLFFNLCNKVNPINNVIVLSKEDKEDIYEKLNIKESMLRKYLKKLNESDVLRKTSTNRYMINPLCVCRASVDRIKELIDEYENIVS